MLPKVENKLSDLKVALVHDFFTEFGGAERVMETLHDLFPKSAVYTALVNPKRLGVHWERLKNWDFQVSWFGKIPLLRNYPSLFRFLTASIWESFDFSGFDVVISSSGWFMCKGILTRPETLHISYIHHQNKFLTFYETPDAWQNNFFKRIYGYLVGPGLRMWDYQGSQRPDIVVANSEETRKRIQKYYRRDNLVIYPPISDPKINLNEKISKTKDYYLTVNRLTKPKHIEVLIDTANRGGFPLYVVGTGREYAYLKALAKKNVVFTGGVSDSELARLRLEAKGFLFASVDEEFGMAPAEAMMYGVPVIAYASGGLKEIVVSGQNGWLVTTLEADEYLGAIKQLENLDYPSLVQSTYKSALRFETDNFKQKMLNLVFSNLKK